MDAKKLKLIVRGDKKPTFGTDPNEPWSVRAGITESERGELHAYLKSRGINPDFVSKDTKISHAKSSEFHKWRRDHQFDDPINFVSTTVADRMKQQRAQTEEVEIEEGKTLQHTPVELRQHAIDKEKHMTKVLHHNGLHKEESEQIDELAPETLASYVLKTTSKDPKRAEPRKKAMSKLAKIMAKRSFSEEKKPTALEKFRAAAAEREKKHDEIQKKQSKDGSGMTAAIDRLEKHLNKEESEQIDEKNVPTSPEKWARAKAAAKSKFAVYPSAYANGWASKKYKAMGGGWKSVKEEIDLAEKNDSHTHAAHYEDPKTGEWTGMNLLIAKDDDDAVRQAHEKCKEGCRLTKVERHITVKEEVEQIDELKMSTVKSYHKKRLTDFSYTNKKPGETSTKQRNARIKKVSAGIDRSIDRQTGYKPTSESAGISKTKETKFHKKLDTLVHNTFGKRKDELKMKEDVFQDTQAATQTAFDMGTQADDREPTYSKRKEMSKSARMIKSLYKKHKMVKEDLYDHEKEDKSVATYGKKPKAEKQEVYGDDDTQAAMILKGGTTLTGQTRDTLEIDPVMRKPVRPDNKISDKKTDK
jgi:hypothetical protein